MKRDILIATLLILSVVSAVVYAQRNRRVPTTNTTDQGSARCGSTEDAKAEARLIEADLTKYATTTKDIFGKSTEGGQQTDYTLGGERKMIKQTFYAETGKSEISYFLENDKVFYFEKNNSEYLVPLSQDSTRKIKSTELNEFYIDGDQHLCSWYSNDQIQPNTQAAQDTVKYLVTDL